MTNVHNKYAMSYEEFAKHFYVEDGVLYRLTPTRKQKVGTAVGHKNDEGYLKVLFNGRSVPVHRIIFLLTHGYCSEVVDHINGIKDDNRAENLRAATNAQNIKNSKLSVRNKTGVKGVHALKNGTGYQVYISIDSKRKRFGTFKDIELAELVAVEARAKYHGAFANNGVRL